MYACEYHFFPNRDQSEEEFIQKIWSLVGALRQNGQTLNEDFLIFPGSPVRYLCLCPEKDSLAGRFHNKWVRRDLRAINQCSRRAPKHLVLSEVAEMPRACGCKRRPFVCLFTHFLDSSSPVVCGGCNRPIPLYRLPASKEYRRNDFLRWQEIYQDCDSLFMMSGAGEKFGYDQLSQFKSSLTKQGRELCSKLEHRLKIPVYYYLHRYHGSSSEGERKRRCPGCGGRWLLDPPLGRYDFRCEKCRLISVVAVDFQARELAMRSVVPR